MSVDQFMQQQNLFHCQNALNRIKAGTSGYKGEDDKMNFAEIAFNLAQKFISALDAANLNRDQCSVDMIKPYISDLQYAFNDFPSGLPADYKGAQLISKW